MGFGFGTTRPKFYTMYSDLIKATYCQSYGLNPEMIDNPNNGSRHIKKQVSNGSGLVHVDYMRMCLAHYFVYILGLPTKIGGYKAGYICHSTVIHNRKKMIDYIKTKDHSIYPYWDRLLETIKLYEPKDYADNYRECKAVAHSGVKSSGYCFQSWNFSVLRFLHP